MGESNEDTSVSVVVKILGGAIGVVVLAAALFLAYRFFNGKAENAGKQVDNAVTNFGGELHT